MGWVCLLSTSSSNGQCLRVEKSAPIASGQHRCGEVTRHVQVQDGVVSWQYSGWSVSVGDLAAAIQNGPVIDNTGILGLWGLDVRVDTPLLSPTDDADERSGRDFEYKRNFNTAFEKQLGLSIDLRILKKHPRPAYPVRRGRRIQNDTLQP